MKLKGSCQCGSVSFSVNSKNFYPFAKCYCSICRKTQGGGGFSVNLSAQTNTLKVQGKKFLKVYRARLKNPEDKRAHHSTAERNFCKVCGSYLWLYSPEWPELIHPFASAIDSKLPKPPEYTHLMMEFKADWVEILKKAKDKIFKRYPKESIAEWHDRVVR
jgi:hypothetical protein